MSDTVISVEHLSKRYRLGVIGSGTFKDDLKIWLAKTRGRPNPLAKIDETNENNRPDDLIWALKDINFTVQRGEALGIIGRNGAGKSTLLKILSRVTSPTQGRVRIKGRIASLLEVGTGFHPELTGRENIFLNGAIMGMSRAEVTRKLDEIVDFSGVEKFIDTPVKRYSSGMYVRLAFAVAAHLEPEILIVDEVLAVGDAEFQKKCLGKMGDVASEGRTVLFVSHNMGAIASLCQRALLIAGGRIELDSDVNTTISRYLNKGSTSAIEGVFPRKGYDEKKDLIKSVELLNGVMKPQTNFVLGDTIQILVSTNEKSNKKFGIHVRLKNAKQELIGFASSLIDSNSHYNSGQQILITLPNINLVQGTYCLDFICNIPNVEHVDNYWDEVTFSIISSRPGKFPYAIHSSSELGNVVFSNAIFSIK